MSAFMPRLTAFLHRLCTHDPFKRDLRADRIRAMKAKVRENPIRALRRLQAFVTSDDP